MALVQCAECGREMSDKAAACPHCGAPNPKIPPPLPTPATKPMFDPPAPQRKQAGCGTIVLVAVGIVVLLSWLLPDSPTRAPAGAPSSPGSAESSAPEIELLSYNCTENSAGAIASGRVRNVSGRQFATVRVVASFYTANDVHLESEDSFLDLRPLLPGQESGFKVYGPRNPQYGKCSIDGFQEGFRGQLRWRRAGK